MQTLLDSTAIGQFPCLLTHFLHCQLSFDRDAVQIVAIPHFRWLR